MLIQSTLGVSNHAFILTSAQQDVVQTWRHFRVPSHLGKDRGCGSFLEAARRVPWQGSSVGGEARAPINSKFNGTGKYISTLVSSLCWNQSPSSHSPFRARHVVCSPSGPNNSTRGFICLCQPARPQAVLHRRQQMLHRMHPSYTLPGRSCLFFRVVHVCFRHGDWVHSPM